MKTRTQSTKPRVLLINPPFTRYGRPVEIQADEPLGIMYLAAYLRERGYPVRILDAFLGIESRRLDEHFYVSGIPDEQIRAVIEEFRPDVVGITSMFTMHSRGAHDTARLVKGIAKDILVVFGGSHASALPEIVLKDGNVDLVVLGEGEKTLEDVLTSGPQDVRSVPGTAVREGGTVKINPPRPFLKDLDGLPFPARDLVPMDHYLNDYYRRCFAMAPPRANIVTSRGCMFKCPFCSIHSIWRHSWRGFSAKRVGDELEYLIKTYKIREVAFQDDNLTHDKGRIAGICDEILRRGLRLRWCTPNGIAIWTLDRDLLKKMKRSGCYKVTFGIDTGSPATQKFVRKTHINLEKARETIAYCNRIGLWTHSSFIIGFPYETRDDVEATINYAVSTDLDFAAFFVATPFPGTELYEIYRKENLIPLEIDKPDTIIWEGCQQVPMCNTRNFGKEELDRMVGEAHARFYGTRIRKFLNPMRLIRKARDIDGIRYAAKLAGMYRGTVGTLTSSAS